MSGGPWHKCATAATIESVELRQKGVEVRRSKYSLRSTASLALLATVLGLAVLFGAPSASEASSTRALACTPDAWTWIGGGNQVRGEGVNCPYPLQVCLQNNSGLGWSPAAVCCTCELRGPRATVRELIL